MTRYLRAVKAALQIQRELAGAEVRVRVGLNAGEPIAKDDDYFGSAVQLAARVCDRAEPGQVLVSKNGKLRIQATDLANPGRAINEVRLGLVAGSVGARGGSLLIDNYTSSP